MYNVPCKGTREDSEMSENKNMELWNQVCVTDPSITKHVGQRGGFTAIDAQSQIKRATELWGPYGGKWVVDACTYEFLGEDVMLQAIFHYPGGEFDIATDMKFKAGNDTCKKLLTDLTTKALSKLGFNSDVFEGKFDDNKYVAGLKNGKPKSPPQKIDSDQLQTIGKLIKETTTDYPEFEKHFQKKFGVETLEELSYVAGQYLIGLLNRKLDKQNADN